MACSDPFTFNLKSVTICNGVISSLLRSFHYRAPKRQFFGALFCVLSDFNKTVDIFINKKRGFTEKIKPQKGEQIN